MKEKVDKNLIDYSFPTIPEYLHILESNYLDVIQVSLTFHFDETFIKAK